MAVLDAVLAGRVTPQAGYLWQVIQAYSFHDGYCTMTDVELGRHMGGMTGRQVFNLRAGLRAANLLEELPGPRGSHERRLIALRGEALGEAPGGEASSGGAGSAMKYISHEIHFMEMGQEEEEEEELINALKPDLLKTPPPLPDRRAREAIGRKSISGPGDLTSLARDVNSAAEQLSASELVLARYMIDLGVFPRIAAELARRFLARRDLADAKAEVQAWWFSATEGEDIQGVEDGDDERLRGRLVTRLRAAAEGGISPPLAALGKALDAMREYEDALSEEVMSEDWEQPSSHRGPLAPNYDHE